MPGKREALALVLAHILPVFLVLQDVIHVHDVPHIFRVEVKEPGARLEEREDEKIFSVVGSCDHRRLRSSVT